MPYRILAVGNCAADHAAIQEWIEEHFDAAVCQAHGPADALADLRHKGADLVLVNRKLDSDSSDGIEIIRQIKADPRLAPVPCMLITNFAEYQQLAVQAGAEPGFGKRDLHNPAAVAALKRVLGKICPHEH